MAVGGRGRNEDGMTEGEFNRLNNTGDEYLLMRPSSNWNLRQKGKMRDAECVRLKALGWTLEDIAKELGLDQPNPEKAQMRVAAGIKRALGEMARFAGDEMRLMELRSLDELEWQAWKALQTNNYMISQGRVVLHEDTGEPVTDNRFILEVVDRILKCKERRAKLMGLDAPQRREVITMDSIDAEIAKLEAEVNNNASQDVKQ